MLWMHNHAVRAQAVSGTFTYKTRMHSQAREVTFWACGFATEAQWLGIPHADAGSDPAADNHRTYSIKPVRLAAAHQHTASCAR